MKLNKWNVCIMIRHRTYSMYLNVSMLRTGANRTSAYSLYWLSQVFKFFYVIPCVITYFLACPARAFPPYLSISVKQVDVYAGFQNRDKREEWTGEDQSDKHGCDANVRQHVQQLINETFYFQIQRGRGCFLIKIKLLFNYYALWLVKTPAQDSPDAWSHKHRLIYPDRHI